MTPHENRIRQLERVIRDAAEAIERGSSTAPVAECLRAALGDKNSVAFAQKTLGEHAYVGERFRHKKRGSVETVVGVFSLQSDKRIAEGTYVVAYVGADGDKWCRPESEFFDGRFEKI